MKIVIITLVALIASVLIAAMGFGLWYMGISNTANELEVRYAAESGKVENGMDNMRKVLMSQYGVTKDYADAVIKSISENQKGRVGGSFVKVTTEGAVQNISTDLYGKMMNSIEGKLAEFQRAQNERNDVWRQHKKYCTTMPQSWFLKGRVFPAPTMITSSVSKEAMKTGILDDDVLGRQR